MWGGWTGQSSSNIDVELYRLRGDHEALELEWRLIKRDHFSRKYSPEQPRVPGGNPDGGQWTSGGGETATEDDDQLTLNAQPVFLDARQLTIGAIEAGLTLYTWLSAQNALDKQAIIAFNARGFRVDESGELNLTNVDLLNRDQVDAACPRLGEVQQRTEAATAIVRSSGENLSPAQFGTAVHTNLKQQIEALNDPNFQAEVSYIKSQSAQYGDKGSIRIDVLERVGNGTVCVYDIKTGERGLSASRMLEISANSFKVFPDTRRIIISEIRTRR